MAGDNGSVGGVKESSSFNSSIGGHESAFKYPSFASHGGDMPGNGGGGGSGCVWRVYFAVRFTRSTMFKSRIERDTFDTARPLYQDMGEMAEKWLRNAGERKLMMELLPHAKSVKAAAKRGRKRRGTNASDAALCSLDQDEDSAAAAAAAGGSRDAATAETTAATVGQDHGPRLLLMTMVGGLMSSFRSSRRERQQVQEDGGMGLMFMLVLVLVLVVGLVNVWFLWQLLQMQRQVWGVQQQVFGVQQQVLVLLQQSQKG